MIVLKPCVPKVRLDELAFSPDGAAIAAPAGHQGVMLWTAFTNGAKAELHKLGIVCKRLAFTSDSKSLVTGNDSLCQYGLADQTVAKLPIVPWHFLWFALSPDGTRLVVSEEDKARENCRVTGWNVGDYRELVWEVNVVGLVWSPPLFSADGKEFVFSVHRRAADRQWHAHRVRHSAATGKELDAAGPFLDVPEVMVRSADGHWLACRTREVVRVYPATGAWKDVPTITNDSKKHFTGIAFHPSGKYLAATSNDKTVKLYDTATWQLTKTYTWDIGKMRSVCFSPDGTLAAAGSDTGKVVVWDVDE